MKLRLPAVAIALVSMAMFATWHARAPASVHAAVARAAAMPAQPPHDPERHASRATQPQTAREVRDTREDSLRGTVVDGAVNFDAAGHALADRDLRRLFDYWLARLGERDIAEIRLGLLAHLRDVLRLDHAAQAQVMTWFDLYVATARAVAAAPRTGQPSSDAALLRELHEHYLGVELARAWFGADDDYAAYTAQRLALAHERDMSTALRSQRLDELDASLDPAERDGRRAATDFQIAALQSDDFTAADTEADSRFAERAALWGDAVALRLGALDQQEDSWRARAADYARQREQVLADTNLPASVREARLAALLTRFSEPEQRRLLSLAQASALPN